MYVMVCGAKDVLKKTENETCLRLKMYICTYAYACIVFERMHMSAYIYIYIYIYIYAYMMYTYVRTHIAVNTQIYIYTNMHTRIYI